jgi:glucose/mannose-6-phosphate isomerase
VTVLDDREALGRNDPDDMLGHVLAFSEHLRAAVATADRALGAAGLERPRAIVVAGMGGSAIAGDLLRGLLSDTLPIPLVVSRSYTLPGFVGPSTLVVASSYSGNTEETLAAHAEAVERGARVVCLTTGGRLGEEAARRNETIVPLRTGLPPRAALGFGLASLLCVLHAAGVADEPMPEVRAASDVAAEAARRFGPEVPSDSNEAKGLAVWLRGHVPVIYGSEPATAAAAVRWAGQLSENAKTVAHQAALPEMNHNEIVGFSDAGALGGAARAVFLRDEDDHERVKLRIETTQRVLADSGVASREVTSFGESRFARLVSLVLTGDYASVYRAALAGVDPTPVEPIDRLKRALADDR